MPTTFKQQRKGDSVSIKSWFTTKTTKTTKSVNAQRGRHCCSAWQSCWFQKSRWKPSWQESCCYKSGWKSSVCWSCQATRWAANRVHPRNDPQKTMQKKKKIVTSGGLGSVPYTWLWLLWESGTWLRHSHGIMEAHSPYQKDHVQRKVMQGLAFIYHAEFLGRKHCPLGLLNIEAIGKVPKPTWSVCIMSGACAIADRTLSHVLTLPMRRNKYVLKYTVKLHGYIWCWPTLILSGVQAQQQKKFCGYKVEKQTNLFSSASWGQD